MVKWSHLSACSTCDVGKGLACITSSGVIAGFPHVGRTIVPNKQLLHVEDCGTVQAELVSIGGQADSEGMVTATFRLKPDEARKLSPTLFRWVELTATTAAIVPED